jgi:hypothetical protein
VKKITTKRAMKKTHKKQTWKYKVHTVEFHDLFFWFLKSERTNYWEKEKKNSSHPTSGESKQVHSCEVVLSLNQLYEFFRFAN